MDLVGGVSALRTGLASAGGGAAGIWLAAAVLQAWSDPDVVLLTASAVGAALGAALAIRPKRGPMDRMEDSMDAMFLGPLGAVVAAGILFPPPNPAAGAPHVVTAPMMPLMDALMGAMLGGGIGAWWPFVLRPRVCLILSFKTTSSHKN